MLAEYFWPIRFMMESDHDITPFYQGLCSSVIFTNLARFIMMGSIDVDRRIVFSVEEVRLREVARYLVLGVAWHAKHKLVYQVEPALLELAVASFAESGQSLFSRPCAAGKAAFRS
jgi:hypothetical protein